MIPNILHFIWFGPAPMPSWARSNLDRFRALNPDYEVLFHGEEVLLDKYRAVYDRIDAPSSRSDLLRYSALQRHGGWYWDLDFVPFRPVADIVRAFQLDGSTMFASRQANQRNPKLDYAATPLAATSDWSGWEAVDRIVFARAEPYRRTAFGPELIGELARAQPHLFTVSDAPWFFPANAAGARRVWAAARMSGGARYARRLCPETGSQLPFAMHLWADGATGDLAAPSRAAHAEFEGDPAGPFHGRRAVLAALEMQWADDTQPFRGIARGLAAAGFDTVVADLPDVPDALVTGDLLVVWNGRKSTYLRLARRARRYGLPVLNVEHGFFDRRAHVQIDHQGILHWASWRHRLSEPAPPEGADRLARVWPRPIEPVRRRRDGYVLVLGQVKRDSQLDESAFQSSAPLEKLVARSLPEGVQAVFRAHPKSRRQRSNHLPVCEAETLEEAVRGARLAVTINSNAGNECLALGCPVLCFGPALYATAGVARRTTPSTFRADLADVLNGAPPPDEDAVRNYLEWLACRQWNADDLADGKVIAELVGRAFE